MTKMAKMTNVAQGFGYDIAAVARAKTAQGLTKGALAELAGVHATTIKNVLTGASGTPTTMGKIAKALKLDLDDITIPIVPGVQTR